MINYELVQAEDVFDDDNDGLSFGINWLDEDGFVIDCEWFESIEERQEAIDRAYTEDENNFEFDF